MIATRTSIAIILFLAGTSAFGADGGTLYTANGCNTCHGATGDEPILPTYPKIAGQNREYLVRQMQDIKDGSRDNGASIAMRALVANLSDDEIAAIADYLSKL